MKFRKLIIHNIASIEHAELDFDRSPLSDCEVFLITGKTGAGKSTILDAICLALYATTARLTNNRMQGEATDGDQNLTLKDTRQLMRRNTGSCHATLFFTGSNGIDYEACWSVARAYNKPGRKLQSKTWTLKSLASGLTLTKDKEIEAEIQRAIGLDFKQFCRTAMLAQGDFTRFLNSSDNEKAEILEKITGVDIYSRISAKIYELTVQKRAALDKTAALIEGVTLMEPEELASRQKEVADSDALAAQINRDISTLDASLTWLRQLTSLQENLSQQEKACTEAESVFETPQFKERENTLQQWTETAQVRTTLNLLTRHRATLTKCDSEVTDMARDLGALAAMTEALRSQLKNLTALQQETLQKLADTRDHEQLFAQAPAIVEMLGAISSCDKKLKECHATERKLDSLLNGSLQEAMLKTTARQESLDHELSALNSRISALTIRLDSARLPQLRARKDELLRSQNNLRAAKESLDQLAAARERAEKMRIEIEAEAFALESLNSSRAIRSAELTASRTAMNEAEQAMNRQKDTVDKFAVQLRARLKSGDICPVCGQTITAELPADSHLSELWKVARETYEKAANRYDDLHKSYISLEAEIKTRSSQLDKNRAAIKRDTSVSDATVRATEACHICGVAAENAKSQTQLAHLLSESEKEFEKVTSQISGAESLEQQLSSLNSSRQTLSEQRLNQEKALQKATKAVTDCRAELSSYRGLIDGYTSERQRNSEKVHELIADYPCCHSADSMPDRLAEEITSAAAMHASLRTQVDERESALAMKRAELESLTETITDIIELLPGIQVMKDVTSTDIDGAAELASRLKGRAREIKALRDNATEVAAQCTLEIDRFLSAHPDITRKRLEWLSKLPTDEVNNIQTYLGQAREQAASARSLLSNTRLQLNAHIATRPQMPPEASAEAVVTDIRSLTLRRDELLGRRAALVTTIEADIKARLKLGDLITERDRLLEQFRKWDALNTLFGEKTGAKFRKIAQSYVLASLIDNANHYMHQLSDRYTLSVLPGTFVIMLTDAYQGYTSRSAATISGGESFLVSLSLALALSDIDNHLAVDTLFIDEGFGSLSGEPLENAIATLRTLHSRTGRRVGIISHIAALRECLPVQIRVTQEGDFSAGVISVTDTI